MLVPTWQTRRLGDLLGDLIDAYRDYARLSLDRQAHPADYDRKVMHAAIDRIRARRAALDSAADQADGRTGGRSGPALGGRARREAALSRAARALVAVNATLGRDEQAKGLSGVDAFADALDGAYLRLAAFARGVDPPRGVVDLSQAVNRLDLRLAAIEDRDTRTRRSVLRWESDNLVEALDDAVTAHGRLERLGLHRDSLEERGPGLVDRFDRDVALIRFELRFEQVQADHLELVGQLHVVREPRDLPPGKALGVRGDDRRAPARARASLRPGKTSERATSGVCLLRHARSPARVRYSKFLVASDSASCFRG